MAKIIRGIDQNSPEWFDMRLGSIGGSSIPAVLAKGKKKGTSSKMRDDLKINLAKEIITGKRDETYHNKYMDRGHIFEPKARALYEWKYDIDVEQIAMIKSDHPHVHVSPDGLVAPDGSVEIKCLKDTTYIKLLEKKEIQTYHINQCQHIFVVYPSIKWCDYIAYCPELDTTNDGVEIAEKFKDLSPLWVKRLHRDEDMIKLIETEIVKFLRELDALLEKIGG